MSVIRSSSHRNRELHAGTPVASPRGYPYLGRVATQYRIPTLTSRREYFRLPYPITSGAVLTIDGANYKVEEISEKGLRIVSTAAPFEVDAHIEGTLLLTMGTRCPVAGTILRIESNALVVKLERGPSSQDVMREQRHLAKRFPNWKPQ
jgi:hypothetical protein